MPGPPGVSGVSLSGSAARIGAGIQRLNVRYDVRNRMGTCATCRPGSGGHRSRRGLNGYERELLRAPAWQFRELEGALR